MVGKMLRMVTLGYVVAMFTALPSTRAPVKDLTECGVNCHCIGFDQDCVRACNDLYPGPANDCEYLRCISSNCCLWGCH
jgi:hypothetical protein